LSLNPVSLVLVVDVEEDHAVLIKKLLAHPAHFLQLLPLLPAKFAPVVDKAVVASPHVLLEPSVVSPVHPAVRVPRILQQPADDIKNPRMPWRVVFLDLFHLGSKRGGGEIAKLRHVANPLLVGGTDLISSNLQFRKSLLRTI
jgi:hypothetical protein